MTQSGLVLQSKIMSGYPVKPRLIYVGYNYFSSWSKWWYRHGRDMKN